MQIEPLDFGTIAGQGTHKEGSFMGYCLVKLSCHM